MTPAEQTTIERRLRDAYAEAAATVHKHDVSPDAPARPGKRAGRRQRGQTIPLVPLAAAAAVLLIAIGVFVISASLNAGSRQHPAVAASKPAASTAPGGYGGQAALLPRYVVTIPTVSVGLLDVQNAVTGKLTATIKIPGGILSGGYWYALAAEGPRTFIASDDMSPLSGNISYFYRLVIGTHGRLTSITRVGSLVHGLVMGASVTPDGRYVGYLLATAYGKDGQYVRNEVVLANLRTGKVIASWPMPTNDSIAGLSIDANGNALAIGAYSWNPGFPVITAIKHGVLTQWTSVLRPATSGTPIDKLPELLPQASTLALSPDGHTLYEFLQAGNVSASPQQDRRPVTFDLAAVDVSTGRVVSVLRTWRAVWADFIPQLALDTRGDYLLIADGGRLARVNTATDQYTALGNIASLELNQSADAGQFPPGQGPIGPMAW
jgi:hypothetical protein